MNREMWKKWKSLKTWLAEELFGRSEIIETFVKAAMLKSQIKPFSPKPSVLYGLRVCDRQGYGDKWNIE